MKNPIRPFLVLVKALLLFLAVNLLYAWIDPSPVSFSLTNRLLPGFERFPAIRVPITRPDGGVGVQTSLIPNLDIIFAAHEITGTLKTADEYRIVFLGDSSMWGSGLTTGQTLVGVINQAGLETCTGQKVRAYSLGYPSNSAMKDLMIMARANAYSPDMFIWTFSLQAFAPERQNVLVDDNLADYRNLILRYNLKTPYQPEEALIEPGFLDKTLWARRKDLRLQIQVQGFAISRLFFGTDDIRSAVSEDADLVRRLPGPTAKYFSYNQTDNLFKNRWLLPFDTIRVAHEIAGDRPLLLVNEPIYIAAGENSDIRYNWIYPRWAFDQYRVFMQNRTIQKDWHYHDFWDLLPQSEFLDTIFHRNAQGNRHFAQMLIPLILENSCK
jgi:hypothetical protein